jgi:transposase
MISADTLSAITGKGLGYLMALTHEAAKHLLRDRNIQLELFDERLPVTILQEDGKKYVLCGSPYRKAHDTFVFDQMLGKGREALDAVERMVASGRLKTYEKVVRRAQKKLTTSGAARYYEFSYDENQRTFTIIEKTEEIDKARSLCGYYILQTSETDLDDEHVEGTYKKLREVEDAFRDLKDLLDIRPVYHWVDRRVRTHLFLCLLSSGRGGQGTKNTEARRLVGQEKRAHSGALHQPFRHHPGRGIPSGR